MIPALNGCLLHYLSLSPEAPKGLIFNVCVSIAVPVLVGLLVHMCRFVLSWVVLRVFFCRCLGKASRL